MLARVKLIFFLQFLPVPFVFHWFQKQIQRYFMCRHQGMKKRKENDKSRLKQYVSAIKVNEAESSTEESDRSTTSNQHKQQPHSKPQKSKAHKEPPPMWAPGFPGFPPGPPPMHAFRPVRRMTKYFSLLVCEQNELVIDYFHTYCCLKLQC